MRRFILTLLLSVAAQPLFAEPAPVDYQREVAPIFRSYCAGCHNDVDYEGDFSLETFAGLRGGGEEGDPIKPGDGAESLLIQLVEHRAKPNMPPKDEPQLPAEELAILKRWIAEGARGPATDTSILQELVVPARAPAASNFVRPVTAVAFDRDSVLVRWGIEKKGGLVAVAFGDVVEICENVATFAESKAIADSTVNEATLRRFEGMPGKVNAIHFNAQGTQFVVATGVTGLRGVAILWDIETGEKVREFGGHRDVLYDAEISPDGQLLATAGYDRLIKIWRMADGELLNTIDVHKGAIFDLAWHPSGKVLASASADETVKLWRVSDGVRLDTLNQPQGEQNAVLFTPDGNHVISAGADQRLHMWRFVSLDEPQLNPMELSTFAHDAPITAIVLSGKYLVSAAEDRSLKLWSLPDLVEVRSYESQSDIVSNLVKSPAGFIVGRMDGKVSEIEIVEESGFTFRSGPAPRDDALIVPKRVGPAAAFVEVEPNDSPAGANAIDVPTAAKGTISKAGDADVFSFDAVAGQKLTIEVNASRDKSQLDSFIEGLHDDGRPVEQVVLQATRDSWLTFRGKDSSTSDDFRVHNWREMELDEYLYCNGEVVKLWHYPRGPDSGFRVYPGTGSRETYFSTTALAHPLGQPCYTVVALPRGSQPAANGLPIVRLNYENDDDPYRRFGSDSLLLFEVPESGKYLVRISDRRGFGSEDGFHYTLHMRDQKPDFTASIGGKDAKIPKGGGVEFSVNIQRIEGFGGSVRIDISGLPTGLSASTPLTVQAGQIQAFGLLLADDTVAADPDETADKNVKVTATAVIDGYEVSKELGDLGNLQLADAPGVKVRVLGEDGAEEPVLTIHRGQTINARVRVERGAHTGLVEFGGDDCGRNLPHGVFVDNIGLNGLMLLEGQSEREFQITASPIAELGPREFHLKTGAAGGAISQRVVIEVLE
ncbi:MAG: hypothetical protein KDN22_06730 [Verrucomicrobiae bacterium]|nr:hypothetical protein [Verrucomicrobiae bacterium]